MSHATPVIPCAVDCPCTGSLFCGLGDAELATLNRYKAMREYRRGQVVFYAGDAANHLYCVHTGLVKLYKTGRRQQQTVIRLLGVGEFLGYRSLVAGEPYASTAEVVLPATLCIFPRQVFLDVLQRDADLTFMLLVKLASELKACEHRLLIHAQESVRVRTAEMLVQLLGVERPGGPSSIDYELHIPRNELAQAIGTTPETLSRVLSEFREGGVLELTRTSIRVLNVRYLQRLAASTAADLDPDQAPA